MNQVPDTGQREIRVLDAGSLAPLFSDAFRLSVSTVVGKAAHVEVVQCERVGELLDALNGGKFDLAFLHLYHTDGPRYEEVQGSGSFEGQMGREGYISLQGRPMIGLLSRKYGLPVIVVHSVNLDRGLVVEAGAVECLTLPLESQELSLAVRRCLKADSH